MIFWNYSLSKISLTLKVILLPDWNSCRWKQFCCLLAIEVKNHLSDSADSRRVVFRWFLDTVWILFKIVEILSVIKEFGSVFWIVTKQVPVRVQYVSKWIWFFQYLIGINKLIAGIMRIIVTVIINWFIVIFFNQFL